MPYRNIPRLVVLEKHSTKKESLETRVSRMHKNVRFSQDEMHTEHNCTFNVRSQWVDYIRNHYVYHLFNYFHNHLHHQFFYHHHFHQHNHWHHCSCTSYIDHYFCKLNQNHCNYHRCTYQKYHHGYINKSAISIINIRNKLLNLLTKALRIFFYYQC